MNIDVHAHHLPAHYMHLLREGNGPIFGAAHSESTLQEMIAGQDEAGIDVQVLSTGPNSPYLQDAEQAIVAAREVNDTYKRIVEQWDGRFAAFGSVPLPHPQLAAAEAVRCLDELNLAGIHLGCSALGRSLDDPSFAEMWTELDRRAAVVFVHPGGILCGSEPGLAGMGDPGLAVTVGSAAEIAVAALRLAALCRTHRRLRIVIGLLGGSLGALVERVSWLGGRFKGKSILADFDESEPLLVALRRFWYDINFLPDSAAVVRAREVYGVDRLVFGSDAPSLPPTVSADFLQQAGISSQESTRIRCDNSAQLFDHRFAQQQGLHALPHLAPSGDSHGLNG